MTKTKSTTPKVIADFFSSLLGFEPQIEFDQSEDEINIKLQLDQQLSSLVIGHHGEVLTAIQLILSLINQQQSGSWTPIRLDVNDYRQQRQTSLENLAQSTAAKVAEHGQPLSINHLSSYERRIVHSVLADHPDVTTQSQGEPPHRLLVVSPRASQEQEPSTD